MKRRRGSTKCLRRTRAPIARSLARGACGLGRCSAAFQYIWTKRQFVLEMLRLIDGAHGAAVINHTHNELVWTPSHGQPLSPAGYRDLFETLEPRIFGETALLA